MNRIPIYTNSKRKGTIVAGSIYRFKNGDTMYGKEVVRAKHFMRVVSGYGIQEEIYDGYIKNKKGWVGISETDTRKFLVSPMSLWDEKGKTMEFTEDDGKQRFLSEKYMTALSGSGAAEMYFKEHPLPESSVEEKPLLIFK